MGTQAVSNLRMNCMGSKYTGVLTYACARLDQYKSIRPRQSSADNSTASSRCCITSETYSNPEEWTSLSSRADATALQAL